MHSHHSHSGQFCRHAKDDLEVVVREAIRQGFTTYGLSEHAPRYRVEDLFPEEADLTPHDLQATYQDFLIHATALKSKYASQIQLLVSIETDYITELDLTRTMELIDRPEIDYIVGSVHHVNGISIDFDRATWVRSVMAVEAGEVGTTMTDTPDGPVLSTTGTSNAGTDTGIDADSFTPTHTQHEKFLLNYFDAQYEVLTTFQPEVVGHMDLCLLWTPGVSLREIGAVWEKVERNVRYIIGYGGMVEANSASLRKGWETSYPGRDIVRLILSLGGKICLSDDSHGTHHVGLNYIRMRDYLMKEGVKEVWYLLPVGERQAGDEDVGRRRRVVSRKVPGWERGTFWDQIEAAQLAR